MVNESSRTPAPYALPKDDEDEEVSAETGHPSEPSAPEKGAEDERKEDNGVKQDFYPYGIFSKDD